MGKRGAQTFQLFMLSQKFLVTQNTEAVPSGVQLPLNKKTLTSKVLGIMHNRSMMPCLGKDDGQGDHPVIIRKMSASKDGA